MKAVKGNKQYRIEESQKKAYQDAGFDVFDEEGKQVAWGRGRTVPYDEHMKTVQEVERLRELASGRYTEIEVLRAENEALRAEKEALRAANEVLRAENEVLKAEGEGLNKGAEAQKKSAGKQAEKKAGE